LNRQERADRPSSASDPELWNENNQRVLVSQIGRVRSRLRQHAAIRDGGEEIAGATRSPVDRFESAGITLDADSALGHLVVALGLSAFERDTLLLCAGMELSAGFAADCAAAQGEPARDYPTFGLALAALAEPHWSVLNPEAPLRRWRLIEVADGPEAPSLIASRLRIAEWALHFLTGMPMLDPRLAEVVESLDDDLVLARSHRAAADRIITGWGAQPGGSWPVAELIGDDPAGLRSIATAVCRGIGRDGYVLGALPADPDRLQAVLWAWEREMAVRRAATAINLSDEPLTDPARRMLLHRWIERLSGPRLILGRQRLSLCRISLVVEVPPLNLSDRLELWHDAIGAAGVGLERLAGQFHLAAGSIHDAGLEAKLRDPDIPMDRALWQACRARARPRLEDLAARVEPRATWEDMVLSEEPLRLLREIALSVRQRFRVQETWGFADRSDRGLGLAALFTGPSGVGKTMAAEVLANELELDLCRIDLSQVVSKYIGETEKNLRRVFDAADAGGAILLFDEADALFGKRGEVKDSHDRYANIEVGYLLQRMETYHGLAILTTNLKESIDPAFYRRLRFVVAFDVPDMALRAEIWRRVFPPRTPRTDLDWEALARLKVTGGQIHNMALHAASLAADTDEAVSMKHLLRAARVEYAKHDRHLSQAELAGWPVERELLPDE
jgi:hypothetical protein